MKIKKTIQKCRYMSLEREGGGGVGVGGGATGKGSNLY